MSIINNIEAEEHSEPVQTIISEPPTWILSWGISALSFILVFILGISAFIESPDIIQGVVVLESKKAPEAIVSSESGILVRLLVVEKSRVDSGDIVGYLKSIASHDDVLVLEKQIDMIHLKIREGNFNNLGADLRNERHLGELQVSYDEFIQNLITLESYLSTGVNEINRLSISRELVNLQRQNDQLSSILDLQKEEYRLSIKDFNAYAELYEKKVISPREFRDEERKLLSKQQPIQLTTSELAANKSLQEQKKMQQLYLNSESQDKLKSFRSIINRFKSEIESWKRRYVLIAHKTGRIVFTNAIREGTKLDPDAASIYISEDEGNEGEFIGRLTLKQPEIGKVHIGQEVLLKMEAYPHQQFGVIKGKIDYISEMAYADSNFTARVTLKDSDQTSYRKRLDLKNGLIAKAEVITERRTILSKIFTSIYSLINNR